MNSHETTWTVPLVFLFMQILTDTIILVMSEQPSLNQKTGTGYSNFRYFNKTYSNFRYFNKTYSQNFLNMKLALQVLLCTIFCSKKN